MYFKSTILLFFFIFNSFFLMAYDNLNQARSEAKLMPAWAYPYPQIIDHLKEKKTPQLLIFSYGSLMDKQSASRTLSDKSLNTRKPALAYGVRRTFDRDVSPEISPRWCTPNNPKARGMLNLKPSQNDVVNGMLVEVDIDDIPKMLQREEGYDLIPVVVQEWDDLVHNIPRYKIAYTFHAPQDSTYTNFSLFPRPGYYELTRNAAKSLGPLFYLVWLKTTYLADGKTPIIEWEKKVEEGDDQTRALDCL